jgi:hypothetical protein
MAVRKQKIEQSLMKTSSPYGQDKRLLVSPSSKDRVKGGSSNTGTNFYNKAGSSNHSLSGSKIQSRLDEIAMQTGDFLAVSEEASTVKR